MKSAAVPPFIRSDGDKVEEAISVSASFHLIIPSI
jgi:hypothetical protein